MVAYPEPTGATDQSGRASATGRRVASVAEKVKGTTSPVRIAVSPGTTPTRAVGLGTTVTVQRSVAAPPATLTVAWPSARAVRRPNPLTSTTVGRVDVQVTGS